MGILSFLSAENRRARRLEKSIKRANNRFTPKDYRQIALQEVIDAARMENQTALAGLIARFGVVAEPSIEDEKEKDWVCDALIDIGRPVLPHIQKALRTAESVNWVQRTLQNIVDANEYKQELLNVLYEFDTEYERNPDRKIQTIMALSEVRGPEVNQALLRFLNDVDETVRFHTVVAVAAQDDESAREPLLEVMAGDESIRVRNQAVAAFSQLGWLTTGYRKKVERSLPAGYKQDKSGRIVKLGDSQD